MTSSERERRIEAAARAFYAPVNPTTWVAPTVLTRNIAAALDAADEAVPVVPATWDGLVEHLDAMYPADVFTGESGDVGARLVALARKLADAEAAARDFRAVLAKMLVEASGEVRCNCEDCTAAREAIARHPSFSGEEGTET